MNLKYIKKFLSNSIGKKITVIYYGARNRKERYNGVLNSAYGNVFTIILPDGTVKCFNYIDILTKTIKIYI